MSCPRTARGTAGLLLIALLSGAPAHAETLDNDRVIALLKADVGEAAVIAKINAMPCGYDVSVAQLARLKQAKVPGPVLAAMIRRCSADKRAAAPADAAPVERAGVYLQRLPGGHFELAPIEPAYVQPGRGGGNGSLLFPAKSKLSLPGKSARMQASAYRPVFFFLFPANAAEADGFGNDPSDGARTPSGFHLVRFEVDEDGREIVVGKVSKLGASSTIGVELADAWAVSPPEDGAYRVEIVEPLEPGQYAFVERLNGGSYRVYDFEIPARD